MKSQEFCSILVSWLLIGINLMVALVQADTSVDFCNGLEVEDRFLCKTNSGFGGEQWCRWKVSNRLLWTKWQGTGVKLQCARDAECRDTLVATQTELTSLELGFDLEPSLLIEGSGLALNNTLALSATGKIDCRVGIGYEGQVYVGANMRRRKGRLQSVTKQIDYTDQGEISVEFNDCRESDVTVNVPLGIGKTLLDARFECRTRPIARIERKWSLYNIAKLHNRFQFDAINDAMNRLYHYPPPMGLKIAHSAQRGGHRVWVQGACYNLVDNSTYRPICRGCLNYLIENIWSLTKGAAGGQYRVEDCYLRYELYELTDETPIVPPE